MAITDDRRVVSTPGFARHRVAATADDVSSK